MKHATILLLAVVLHVGGHAQTFVNSDGMCLRNDLAYTIDTNNTDSIAAFDPVDRLMWYVAEQRGEISRINGVAPMTSSDVHYDNAELKKFEEYIADFFTKTLEKIPYVEATYRIHVCGIIVDRNGKVCKYEYHGLDCNDAEGTPRTVWPIDQDLVSRVMSTAPPVHPHTTDGEEARYAYVPEVILSRSYRMKKDKTVETKSVSLPAAKHAHRTRRLEKQLHY